MKNRGILERAGLRRMLCVSMKVEIIPKFREVSYFLDPELLYKAMLHEKAEL